MQECLSLSVRMQMFYQRSCKGSDSAPDKILDGWPSAEMPNRGDSVLMRGNNKFLLWK